MDVRIWGCRGSLPAPLTAREVEDKVVTALKRALILGIGRDNNLTRFVREELPFHLRSTYGGNTSCVEVRGGGNPLLLDAGTGLRDFGRDIMARTQGTDTVFDILVSHPHWDHIQGFPFFAPAYIPGNTVVIHGCHQNLQSVFEIQNSSPSFPVDFKALGANIRFEIMEPGRTYDIAGFSVKAMKQRHPGDSYAYRLERDGKSVVYTTDSEHRCDLDVHDNPAVEFFRSADLLIFDAQYSYAEACVSKENWGHSNNIVGVELAKHAGVGHLLLFHLDPGMNDAALEAFLADTRRYSELYDESSVLPIDMAHDGLDISL